jgi:hypothetical protein
MASSIPSNWLFFCDFMGIWDKDEDASSNSHALENGDKVS